VPLPTVLGAGLHTGRVQPSPEVSWADRAAVAELAVHRRYLRRVAGRPGTRIARVRSPRPAVDLRSSWHYWWQAHLLDCLVDAQLRAPAPRRARTIASLVRGVRLRNGNRWTNDYYDDVAWLGLAVQRAGPLAGRGHEPSLRAIVTRLRQGWEGTGGAGIPWRRGDDFRNAPSNGPAAVLLARIGQAELAASITDWVADTLVDPRTGLVRDGVRVAPDGTIRERVDTVYTYCQGVYLGACVSLAGTHRHVRWSTRAAAVLDAVSATLAGPDGVIPGHDAGGDGGLFNGILARYLAVAARRRELRSEAARLVLSSADAAWRGRAEIAGGPVFAPDWRRPAREPGPGVPEADLSVQLSAWMLFEAAAAVQRG
jgi:predicted alpha-1,6-mannanase (GH76 family)